MTQNTTRAGLLSGYDANGYYCELLGAPNRDHPVVELIERQLSTISESELRSRASAAESDLFDMGVTFTVYSENSAIDRVLPFDLIPRVLTASEWATIESGVVQRVTAINLFSGISRSRFFRLCWRTPRRRITSSVGNGVSPLENS